MKLKLIFIALSLLLFSGCSKETQIIKPDFPLPPQIEQSKLPSFPAVVLYVVGREFETVKDGTSKKKEITHKGIDKNIHELSLNQYIDYRLIELYPDDAYIGLADDMEVEGMQTLQQYEEYLDKLKVYEQQLGIYHEPEPPLPTFTNLEEEVLLLDLTYEEERQLRNLNLLATNPEFATLDDFNAFFSANKTLNIDQKTIIPTWGWIAAGGVVVIGTYAVIRAVICKNRALEKQKVYYTNLSSGSKSDAFKHIFVSMMLCRYLSQPTAWLIMDVFWETAGGNYPCDKYMDYHNNYIGRRSQYNTFRGSWWSDMYKWEKWGERVRDFVNISSNGIKKNWDVNSSESAVKTDKNNTDKKKYIYWRD